MSLSNQIKSLSIPHTKHVLFSLKIDPPLLKTPVSTVWFKVMKIEYLHTDFDNMHTK